MQLVDAGDVLVPRMSRDFNCQVARQHLAQLSTQNIGAGYLEQILKLRIPRLDAVVEIHGKDADLEGLNDIFAEVLEPLDLQSFLFERLIKLPILDGDGYVSCD